MCRLGLSNVVALAGGEAHSLALMADGTLAAWGLNNGGQSTVPPGLNNIVGIAAGAEFSLALKADGSVVAWGRNEHGQTNVPANLTNAVAVAASYWTGLALKADGRVAAWGDEFSATNVPANVSNVLAVVGGAYCGSALKADGSVVVWGYPSATPPSGFTNAVALAGGALPYPGNWQPAAALRLHNTDNLREFRHGVHAACLRSERRPLELPHRVLADGGHAVSVRRRPSRPARSCPRHTRQRFARPHHLCARPPTPWAVLTPVSVSWRMTVNLTPQSGR